MCEKRNQKIVTVVVSKITQGRTVKHSAVRNYTDSEGINPQTGRQMDGGVMERGKEEGMNYDGGTCVGCIDALQWVRNLSGVETEMRDRVWNRMAYEFDKGVPIEPKFHAGKYGHKYDNYTCGRCGFGIDPVIAQYCQNCGQKIARYKALGNDRANNHEKKNREVYEQMVLDFCREDIKNGTIR